MVTKKRKIYYKGVRVNSFGLPILSTAKTARIKEKIHSNKRLYHPSFVSLFSKKAQKNLVVIYDIPEAQKKERDWFRRQLKSFSFIMIQKSVWVGPAPLPKEFLEYIKTIGIEKNFKTFKLATPYKDR